MSSPISFFEKPALRNPALVVGFSGWPNAGEVSTWVGGFLVRSLGAAKCAEIRSDEFYDFTQQRPVVTVEGGLVRSVEHVSNVFYGARTPDPAPRDLLVFLGQEPHLLWTRFTAALLDAALSLGAVELFAVGGLYDGIPHTLPARVSGLVNRPERLSQFGRLGIQTYDYRGPVSIHSNLLSEAGKQGLPATSLWGHVPHYLQSANPKACLAVLERLQELSAVPLDLGEVRRASRLLDEQIERILQGKPELREHVRSLERLHASGEETTRPEPKRPSAPKTPEEKIIRIDPFLRKGPDPNGSR